MDNLTYNPGKGSQEITSTSNCRQDHALISAQRSGLEMFRLLNRVRHFCFAPIPRQPTIPPSQYHATDHTTNTTPTDHTPPSYLSNHGKR